MGNLWLRKWEINVWQIWRWLKRGSIFDQTYGGICCCKNLRKIWYWYWVSSCRSDIRMHWGRRDICLIMRRRFSICEIIALRFAFAKWKWCWSFTCGILWRISVWKETSKRTSEYCHKSIRPSENSNSLISLLLDQRNGDELFIFFAFWLFN